MSRVWVIGSGGHAKVVIDTLLASAQEEVAGVLDDDPARLGMDVLGHRVLGGLSDQSIAQFGVERAVIAIGSNRVRAAIARKFAGRLRWATVVHPRAYVATGACLGEGTVVFAGAVVQPDATVGAHAILNTLCSVDHDNTIGDFAQVGPGAHLAGNVRLGEGGFVGTGATVLPGRAVGPWATIGAGAVVTRDVPGDVTAKGVPARFTFQP